MKQITFLSRTRRVILLRILEEGYYLSYVRLRAFPSLVTGNYHKRKVFVAHQYSLNMFLHVWTDIRTVEKFPSFVMLPKEISKGRRKHKVLCLL